MEAYPRGAKNVAMEGFCFAARLKARARELQLSDAAVARIVGISERRYGHYAKGDREPNLELLVRIARALKTTPDHLLGFEDETDGRPSALAPGLDLARLGNRIHQARTQSARYRVSRTFAASAGIEEARLRQIEDGLVEPTIGEILRMATVLGLAVNELLLPDYIRSMPESPGDLPTVHDPDRDWPG